MQVNLSSMSLKPHFGHSVARRAIAGSRAHLKHAESEARREAHEQRMALFWQKCGNVLSSVLPSKLKALFVRAQSA